MELIFNILPILAVSACLWLGVRNYEALDQFSRHLFGKGLDEE